jgi:mono/diheme cytochrome c family protein
LAKVLFSLGKLPMLASSHIIDFQAPMNQKPEEAPTREFGSYLANSACMGCHGPQFAGGPIPGAPPEWPPAADIRLGQNKIWTEESFISAMRTGVSPRASQPIRPPMPIALTKQMNDMELKALWLF